MLKSIITKIALAGSIAVASTAVLADGAPRRAPAKAPPAAAAVFSWTGFYGGVNAGAAVIDDGAVTTGPADAATLANIGPCVAAGACVVDFPGRSATGAIGGVQLGYNMQAGQFVGGIEVDLQVSTANASRGAFTNVLGFVPIQSAANTSLEWLSTVRGRAGILLNPTTLAYVTGGFAFAEVQRSWGLDVVTLNQRTFGRSVETNTGWTVGGGLELSLTNNITLGAEYLYVNLDGDAFTARAGAQVAACNAANCNVNVQFGDLDLHVARLKLNYKF